MSEQPPEKALATTVGALGEVIKLGKESPDAREAGVYAAKSLKIITQTVHTVLLPLAAANYGATRFADYMKRRFEGELAERLDVVPDEDIISPRAVVAGPVLDALVYAHDETELRRLYLSLLASAMDSRSSLGAHPAFVDVLRQLDATEVVFLRGVFADKEYIAPIARVKIKAESGEGASEEATHILDWRDDDGKALVPDRIATYVDNWIRLGLVEVMYDAYLTAAGVYGWVNTRPEYQEVQARAERPEAIEFDKGVIRATNFGRQFAQAVRIDDAPAESVRAGMGDWRAAAQAAASAGDTDASEG
ncbi:DUF4393 domain-containing protein [Microbacterium sp. NPDC056234]|uniref:DUF4393 domain-containing protein n=1 Tax=Microbacterium sp. NPDC056234 TaxID=3345757 RepID=UPI0035D5A3C9